ATPPAWSPHPDLGTTGTDLDNSPAHAKTPAGSVASQTTGVGATPDNPKRDTPGDPVTGFAHQFLARYDDANQRPVLLEEQRTVIRRQYEKLKDRLKLDDSTFEQLVSLLAEEQLQVQEHWSRCAVDSQCDPRNQRNPNID